MKWYRAAGLFAALALAPGIAAANEGGAYVSVGGLYVMPNDSDLSYTQGDLELAAAAPLDGGPGFTAAIGYGVPNGLRAELEFGYRSSSWSKYEDLRATYGGETHDLDDEDSEGDVTTLSLMVNGTMVFDTSSGLSPYVGAGIGFAKHEVSGEEAEATVQGTTHELESFSEDDTVLAYQAMVGVTYPISENAEARLGYRYFATSEAEFDDFKADYGSHSVELGILFRF